MEQLVLLVIIALISFINWALQKSAERREARKMARASEDPSAQPSTTKASPGGTAEAEMRKFMEALGLPGDSEPPVIQEAPPASPPSPQPVAQRPVTPPPIPTQTARSERRRVEQPDAEMRRLASRIEETEVGASEIGTDEIGTPAKPSMSAAGSSSAYRKLLESPQSLRDAIVVREILGPPKALQES